MNVIDKILSQNEQLNAVSSVIRQQSRTQQMLADIIARKRSAAPIVGASSNEQQKQSNWHNSWQEAAEAVFPEEDAPVFAAFAEKNHARAKQNPDDLSVDENSIPEDLADATAEAGAEIANFGTENTVEDIHAGIAKSESFALNIVLNAKQLAAKEMALSGQSFCLIGAAGTGKTTTQRSVAETLLEDKRLSTSSFKLPSNGGPREYVQAPSIAFCAYTRRATANLRRAIHKNPDLEEALTHNILTIHQLLEYEPETYWDSVEQKEKFRFHPKRTASNPLDITHLVIEEASMLGLDLWEKLYDALPLGVQIIFIGDINQLPPVFGPSILNYALVQLPVVELTEVYRNQGIVLENAHNILNGKTLVESSNYQIVRGNSPTSVSQAKTARSLAVMFETLYKNGQYDPDRHILLTPWNKKELGSDNMNRNIAQFIGASRNAVVHEIIAGFQKHYLAVGDKVMYNKQDGIITNISRNASYYGKEPQIPGTDLTRHGHRIIGAGQEIDFDSEEFSLSYDNFDIDKMADEKAERKQQASHIVDIAYEDGRTETLTAAGDFGPQIFSLGYVLTVHKAQGSEWDKVFIILHKDHAVSLYRELFYTAATRARTDVVIIAKDSVIAKAISTQRIKGQSLQDKIEFFNSGALTVQDVYCTKG